MSFRLLALFCLSVAGSVPVLAEDSRPGAVTVPLPDPADVLIVDKDRAIDMTLRALPAPQAAEVLLLPEDSVKQEAEVSSEPLGLRGPVADRLFPALPWAAETASAVPVPDMHAVAIAATLEAQKPDKKIGKAELKHLAAFYEARGNAPFWHDGADRNGKAEEVLAVLRTAESDGLGIAAYAAPAPIDSSPEAVALADIALSRAVIAYARDASGARIPNPSRISRQIDAVPVIPSADAVLQALAATDDAATMLQNYNPQHAGYKALRLALQKLREARAEEAPADLVPVGKTLRLGESDERVSVLRRRLGVPAESEETLFDAALADAVKIFQRENGIRATGILNRVTTAALNGEPITGSKPGKLTEADLISNMERWRWMPRSLGYNHIFVNIPEFELRIIENDAVSHQTRIVVGKPQTQTPVFSDEVEFVVVNPTWTVPPSIALKEYLPRLRDNPYAMQNRGFEVVRKGRPIDPGQIDWYNPPADVAIRQPPGERNALGHIKFMFPNKHAVYLHDTPQKKYFDQEVRAESHGCVRVADPFALAEVVLGAGWPEDRVRRLIGGKSERNITLSRHMPVHLAYFTVTAGADGDAVKFRDIYGHDEAVKRALGL